MNERAILRATYRLQFNQHFTFADAAQLVPYLHRLGISHVYASPCLKARAGSLHGYDIIDHNAFNPEIGSREAFEHFVDTLHAHRMGLIFDIVPNHMGIAHGENPWWQDVLENGQSSPYNSYFDIDWWPIKEALRGKILLPVLGDHYGRVLENGELRIEFEPKAGEFTLRYWQHRFPLDPETYPDILSHEVEHLAALAVEENHTMTEWHSLVEDFGQLRALRKQPAERARASAGCKQRLAALHEQSAAARAFLESRVALFIGRAGQPDSFSMLHQWLEKQSFRLAYWRVAADEINYRRFFDVNELACVRQDNPEVFETTHRLVQALVADGSVDGLRIDHPDGLFDPLDYCRKLRSLALRVGGGSETDTRAEPTLYLAVEKILAGYEHLRTDWPVDGPTGYQFANVVNGLLVWPGAERELTRLYARFIGERLDFDALLYASKHRVIRTMMSSDLTVLANRLVRLAEMDLHTRDYTLNSLRDALTEVVACFPVYRTYMTENSVSAEDVRFVDWAIAQAKKSSNADENSIFDFLHDLLLQRGLDSKEPDYRSKVAQFAMRFQQYTAPVMAKSMEDTAFYLYNRLASLNDVGGDPRRFGVSTSAFHYANQHRLRHWPQAMLNTSTHDSKRSEDLRTRIDVISELAEEWRHCVFRWSRLNRRKKQAVDEQPAPSRNDEYLLYQTLLGAWPSGISDEASLAVFSERIEAYMLKAVREAKVNSSWLSPNQAYEAALLGFVRALLNPNASPRFWADFIPFQRKVARFGLFNSLSLTLLKLVSPGIPDIYQGTELLSFTLVDPDNRQPVDFYRRENLMQSFAQKDQEAITTSYPLPAWERTLEDGDAKLYLIWRVLSVRQRYPEIFTQGEYLPLEPEGERAEHLCAFARRRDETMLVAIAGRWFARLLKDSKDLPLGSAIWGDTRIPLPETLAEAAFLDVLTGQRVKPFIQAGTAYLDIGKILAYLPVALLVTEA